MRHEPGHSPAMTGCSARLRCQAFLRYICQAKRERRRWPANSTITTIFRALLCSTPNGPGKGYGINMFCMSLMKDENRKAFKANEAEYLKKFKLTPEQTDAVLKRDYNRMLELGGNIYFTAKLGATDGHSFQHLAAVMTGATQQDYATMMLGGGRSVEGNRSRSGKNAPSKFFGGGGGEDGRRKAESKAKVEQEQIQIEISETEVTSWPGSLQA